VHDNRQALALPANATRPGEAPSRSHDAEVNQESSKRPTGKWGRPKAARRARGLSRSRLRAGRPRHHTATSASTAGVATRRGAHLPKRIDALDTRDIAPDFCDVYENALSRPRRYRLAWEHTRGDANSRLPLRRGDRNSLSMAPVRRRALEEDARGSKPAVNEESSERHPRCSSPSAGPCRSMQRVPGVEAPQVSSHIGEALAPLERCRGRTVRR